MSTQSDSDLFRYPYSRPSAICRGCGLSSLANCHPQASIEEFAKSLPEGWTYYPQKKAYCPDCTRNRPMVSADDWRATAKSFADARIDAALDKVKKADRYDGTW